MASQDDVPAIQLNGATEPTTTTTMAQPPPTNTPSVANFGEPVPFTPYRPTATRNDTTYSKFSTVSVPPEGSILTGKQEHCERHARGPSRQHARLIRGQISSASSYRSRHNSRSPSSRHPQPSSALARPSDPTPAKLRRKTRNSLSSATYSFTMSATSPSWTRQRRRSSGKTNCKWYVMR